MQVAFFLLAEEITQVKEEIPWVCCASGNVLKKCLILLIFPDAPYMSTLRTKEAVGGENVEEEKWLMGAARGGWIAPAQMESRLLWDGTAAAGWPGGGS